VSVLRRILGPLLARVAVAALVGVVLPASETCRNAGSRLTAISETSTASRGGTVRWYTHTDTDVIMRNDADTWLWVRARTTNALDATRAALPGTWSSTPP
jgi:chlorite dismutase